MILILPLLTFFTFTSPSSLLATNNNQSFSVGPDGQPIRTIPIDENATEQSSSDVASGAAIQDDGTLHFVGGDGQNFDYEFERYDFDDAIALLELEVAVAVIVNEITSEDVEKLLELSSEVGLIVLHGEVVLFTSGNEVEIELLASAQELLADASFVSHTHVGHGHLEGPSFFDLVNAVDGSSEEHVVTENGVYAYNSSGVLNEGNAISHEEFVNRLRRALVAAEDADHMEARRKLNEFIYQMDLFNEVSDAERSIFRRNHVDPFQVTASTSETGNQNLIVHVNADSTGAVTWHDYSNPDMPGVQTFAFLYQGPTIVMCCIPVHGTIENETWTIELDVDIGTGQPQISSFAVDQDHTLGMERHVTHTFTSSGLLADRAETTVSAVATASVNAQDDIEVAIEPDGTARVTWLGYENSDMPGVHEFTGTYDFETMRIVVDGVPGYGMTESEVWRLQLGVDSTESDIRILSFEVDQDQLFGMQYSKTHVFDSDGVLVHVDESSTGASATGTIDGPEIDLGVEIFPDGEAIVSWLGYEPPPNQAMPGYKGTFDSSTNTITVSVAPSDDIAETETWTIQIAGDGDAMYLVGFVVEEVAHAGMIRRVSHQFAPDGTLVTPPVEELIPLVVAASIDSPEDIFFSYAFDETVRVTWNGREFDGVFGAGDDIVVSGIPVAGTVESETWTLEYSVSPSFEMNIVSFAVDYDHLFGMERHDTFTFDGAGLLVDREETVVEATATATVNTQDDLAIDISPDGTATVTWLGYVDPTGQNQQTFTGFFDETNLTLTVEVPPSGTGVESETWTILVAGDGDTVHVETFTVSETRPAGMKRHVAYSFDPDGALVGGPVETTVPTITTANFNALETHTVEIEYDGTATLTGIEWRDAAGNHHDTFTGTFDEENMMIVVDLPLSDASFVRETWTDRFELDDSGLHIASVSIGQFEPSGVEQRTAHYFDSTGDVEVMHVIHYPVDATALAFSVSIQGDGAAAVTWLEYVDPTEQDQQTFAGTFDEKSMTIIIEVPPSNASMESEIWTLQLDGNGNTNYIETFTVSEVHPLGMAREVTSIFDSAGELLNTNETTTPVTATAVADDEDVLTEDGLDIEIQPDNSATVTWLGYENPDLPDVHVFTGTFDEARMSIVVDVVPSNSSMATETWTLQLGLLDDAVYVESFIVSEVHPLGMEMHVTYAFDADGSTTSRSEAHIPVSFAMSTQGSDIRDMFINIQPDLTAAITWTSYTPAGDSNLHTFEGVYIEELKRILINDVAPVYEGNYAAQWVMDFELDGDAIRPVWFRSDHFLTGLGQQKSSPTYVFTPEGGLDYSYEINYPLEIIASTIELNDLIIEIQSIGGAPFVTWFAYHPHQEPDLHIFQGDFEEETMRIEIDVPPSDAKAAKATLTLQFVPGDGQIRIESISDSQFYPDNSELRTSYFFADDGTLDTSTTMQYPINLTATTIDPDDFTVEVQADNNAIVSWLSYNPATGDPDQQTFTGTYDSETMSVVLDVPPSSNEVVTEKWTVQLIPDGNSARIDTFTLSQFDSFGIESGAVYTIAPDGSLDSVAATRIPIWVSTQEDPILDLSVDVEGDAVTVTWVEHQPADGSGTQTFVGTFDESTLSVVMDVLPSDGAFSTQTWKLQFELVDGTYRLASFSDTQVTPSVPEDAVHRDVYTFAADGLLASFHEIEFPVEVTAATTKTGAQNLNVEVRPDNTATVTWNGLTYEGVFDGTAIQVVADSTPVIASEILTLSLTFEGATPRIDALNQQREYTNGISFDTTYLFDSNARLFSEDRFIVAAGIERFVYLEYRGYEMVNGALTVTNQYISDIQESVLPGGAIERNEEYDWVLQEFDPVTGKRLKVLVASVDNDNGDLTRTAALEISEPNSFRVTRYDTDNFDEAFPGSLLSWDDSANNNLALMRQHSNMYTETYYPDALLADGTEIGTVTYAKNGGVNFLPRRVDYSDGTVSIVVGQPDLVASGENNDKPISLPQEVDGYDVQYGPSFEDPDDPTTFRYGLLLTRVLPPDAGTEIFIDYPNDSASEIAYGNWYAMDFDGMGSMSLTPAHPPINQGVRLFAASPVDNLFVDINPLGEGTVTYQGGTYAATYDYSGVMTVGLWTDTTLTLTFDSPGDNPVLVSVVDHYDSSFDDTYYTTTYNLMPDGLVDNYSWDGSMSEGSHNSGSISYTYVDVNGEFLIESVDQIYESLSDPGGAPFLSGGETITRHTYDLGTGAELAVAYATRMFDINGTTGYQSAYTETDYLNLSQTTIYIGEGENEDLLDELRAGDIEAVKRNGDVASTTYYSDASMTFAARTHSITSVNDGSGDYDRRVVDLPDGRTYLINGALDDPPGSFNDTLFVNSQSVDGYTVTYGGIYQYDPQTMQQVYVGFGLSASKWTTDASGNSIKELEVFDWPNETLVMHDGLPHDISVDASGNLSFVGQPINILAYTDGLNLSETLSVNVDEQGNATVSFQGGTYQGTLNNGELVISDSHSLFINFELVGGAVRLVSFEDRNTSVSTTYHFNSNGFVELYSYESDYGFGVTTETKEYAYVSIDDQWLLSRMESFRDEPWPIVGPDSRRVNEAKQYVDYNDDGTTSISVNVQRKNIDGELTYSSQYGVYDYGQHTITANAQTDLDFFDAVNAPEDYAVVRDSANVEVAYRFMSPDLSNGAIEYETYYVRDRTGNFEPEMIKEYFGSSDFYFVVGKPDYPPSTGDDIRILPHQTFGMYTIRIGGIYEDDPDTGVAVMVDFGLIVEQEVADGMGGFETSSVSVDYPTENIAFFDVPLQVDVDPFSGFASVHAVDLSGEASTNLGSSFPNVFISVTSTGFVSVTKDGILYSGQLEDGALQISPSERLVFKFNSGVEGQKIVSFEIQYENSPDSSGSTYYAFDENGMLEEYLSVTESSTNWYEIYQAYDQVLVGGSWLLARYESDTRSIFTDGSGEHNTRSRFVVHTEYNDVGEKVKEVGVNSSERDGKRSYSAYYDIYNRVGNWTKKHGSINGEIGAFDLFELVTGIERMNVLQVHADMETIYFYSDGSLSPGSHTHTIDFVPDEGGAMTARRVYDNTFNENFVVINSPDAPGNHVDDLFIVDPQTVLTDYAVFFGASYLQDPDLTQPIYNGYGLVFQTTVDGVTTAVVVDYPTDNHVTLDGVNYTIAHDASTGTIEMILETQVVDGYSIYFGDAYRYDGGGQHTLAGHGLVFEKWVDGVQTLEVIEDLSNGIHGSQISLDGQDYIVELDAAGGIQLLIDLSA